MSIHYPCETAAIFNNVVFVINPQDKGHLADECDRAYEFYRNFFPGMPAVEVLHRLRFSFGGLYLSVNDIQREALS
ncbi:TPA: hypothetical protein RUY31_003605 [Klebsiella quasipneumoniae subsp. similipneumoniae]|nr:hypothetical protein [Klebsiella quasipneumoniae subsp. similipneumoniae]